MVLSTAKKGCLKIKKIVKEDDSIEVILKVIDKEKIYQRLAINQIRK